MTMPTTSHPAAAPSHRTQAMLRSSLARRVRPVIVVEGITAPKLRELEPHEFDTLHIDDRYQRQPQDQLINDLVVVLKSGGAVYDPLTLAERRGEPGRYYVVDGQQRMWAHMRCGLPIPVLIYQSEGWESEAQLFQAMNTSNVMTANARIKSHQGRTAGVLRTRNAIDGQPYFDLIDFGQGGFRPYSAMLLVRAMCAAGSGGRSNGSVRAVLPRIDAALDSDPTAASRVDLVLELLPKCFVINGKTRLPQLPSTAVGLCVYRRIRGGGTVPTGFAGLIRRINWAEFVPSNAQKFLPTVVERMLKHWPE